MPFLRFNSFQPLNFKRFASQETFDVAIIGAGPGGYVAAIKAAQLGLKTVSIEKRGALGGTCLNVGCIPSKSLLHNSHLYHQILHDTKKRGIDVKDVSLNLENMLKAKEQAVTSLTKGIEYLYRKNGVTYLKGTASFADQNIINVELNDGGASQILAKNIIIATGSESSGFPGITIDEKKFVSSTGALEFRQVPEKLLVVGGGIIGLELGSVWSRLGSHVTVVEFLPSIGANMDADIATEFTKIIKKQGLEIMTNTKVISGKTNGDKVELEIETKGSGKKSTLEADACLVCIGRKPYTEGLGLEKVGIEKDAKGRIIIDSQYRTNIAHIRVIGDTTFGPMLAHKAEEEGIAAVEYISKGHGHVNYNAIPSVMYTHPEVAWVGQTEQQAKESGKAYNIGKFPFSANSRGKTILETDGLVKFVTDKETDRILGVHIIGPSAGELIAEAVLAVEYGASSEDVARTCHSHPTLSEAVKEAALAAHSKAIHI